MRTSARRCRSRPSSVCVFVPITTNDGDGKGDSVLSSEGR